MAALLAEGSNHLATAFERLERRGKAVGSGDRGGRRGREEPAPPRTGLPEAASALLKLDDLREVVGRRELYRRFSRVSETLIEAADRVWYATVKEG